MFRSNQHLFLKTIPFVVALLMGVRPLASQSLTTTAFISSVNSDMQPLLGLQFKQPIIMGANLEFAQGAFISSQKLSDLLDYVDGLKAVGAQRIEINPGYLSLQDPAIMAMYDAIVLHIRQLGLQLAINTVVVQGQNNGSNFTEFQANAAPAVQQIAARYQPDNLVIVHEPDSMNTRLTTAANGSPSNFSPTPTVADWDGFIQTVAPLVKAVSPHTRLGAGCYYAAVTSLTQVYVDNENAYFQSFAALSELDFLTMDIYNDDTFSQYQQWAQLAIASGKSVYIEETWIPHYFANGLTSYNSSNLDTQNTLGPCDAAFSSLYGPWIQALALFASNNGMESVTIFSSPAFFAYGTSVSNDEPEEGAYEVMAASALEQGQLTSAGQAYMSTAKQMGIKVATSLSSASYATLPSVYCSPASNPCNANSTVAPDELVSTYGTDLASDSVPATSATLPTILGGTSATLVDSSGTSYPLPLSYVSPTQINYLVPSAAKPGAAVLTIVSGDATITTGWVLVAGVNPGLYTASATGKGTPAAFAVCAGTCAGWPGTANQYGQFVQEIFSDCGAAGGCKTVPINLGSASDSVVLELFGTGIRHVASTASVTATINGHTVPVLFAGAQGQFPGEDQINVELPHSLAGSGTVNVVLATTVSASDLAAYDADATSSSNTVTIDIE
jgi:uncharacterized protein (TIGR03437 family)